METIVLFFVQSIIGGITGNRADSITTSALQKLAKRLKKTGEPINHDVERAIRKSYLLATLVICRLALKTERKSLKWNGYFANSQTIKWLNKVIKSFTHEVRQLEKPEYEVRIESEIKDPSIFLDQDKDNLRPNTYSTILENELKHELEGKFGQIPEPIQSFLLSEKPTESTQSWYELLCAFFAEELKENTRLRSIFDAQILADLRKEGLNISVELFEESLSKISEHTLIAIEQVKSSLSDHTKSLDRVEERLQEIYDVLKEQAIRPSEKHSIVHEFAGYERNQFQGNRIEQLTKDFLIGREKELAHLDHFIDSNDSGVILLTAPAGYGKSAVLANWIQQKKLDGLPIISFFFSTDQQSSTQAYAHLLRQVLDFFDRKSELLPERTDLLRDTLLGLLNKEAPPQDQPLILVIDGLDESDIPIQAFFQQEVPRNVFVIASLRTNEFNEIPEPYGSWKAHGDNLALSTLTQDALKNWLRQLHADAPETELEQLSKLYHEKTTGYPLYLKFLFDELKNTPQQSIDDLKRIISNAPVGFEQYVRAQFNTLAKQSEVQQRKELQALFSLLTVAKGPLADTDIEAILGLTTWDLHSLPWVIERWLNIHVGAQASSYSFAHPLLAHTFAQILGRGAKEAEQKLLAYCGLWNMHKSKFVLRYYVQQLLAVDQYNNALQLVVGDKTWLLTKRAQFKTDRYVLEDTELLLQYIQDKQVEPFLEDVVQIFAVKEVILKRAARIKPMDVRILVAKGEAEEAIEMASLQTSLYKKIELWLAILLELADASPDKLRIESLIMNAFQNAKNIEQHTQEIALVLQDLSNENKDEFLKRFCKNCFNLDHNNIAPEKRIDFLCLIHPYLEAEDQKEILDRITLILQETTSIHILEKADALSRVNHPALIEVIEKFFIEDNIIGIEKLINHNFRETASIYERIFDRSFALLKKDDETSQRDIFNSICLKVSIAYTNLGIKDQAIRLINFYAQHTNNQRISPEVILKLIPGLASQGFINDVVHFLSIFKNTIWGVLAKINSAAVLLGTNQLIEWEQWCIESIEHILTGIDTDPNRSMVVEKLLNSLHKIYINKPLEKIIPHLQKLIPFLDNDSARCTCARQLFQMNNEELAQQVLGQIEDLHNLGEDESGKLALMFFNRHKQVLADKFYQIYLNVRLSYDLYERGGLSLLCAIIRQLDEIGQKKMGEHLLNYAYKLAQQTSAPNVLKLTELERLAALLLEKGRIEDSQSLQQVHPYFIIENLDFAPTEVMLSILADSAADSLSSDVVIGDLLFHVYNKSLVKSTKSKPELQDLFEKAGQKLLHRLKDNPFKFWLLGVKKGFNVNHIIGTFMYDFIFSDSEQRCHEALIRFCSGLVANGYNEFAQQVFRENDFLQAYFELKNIQSRDSSAFYQKLSLIDQVEEKNKSNIHQLKSHDLISTFSQFDQSERNSFLEQFSALLFQNNVQSTQKNTTLNLLRISSEIIAWEDGLIQGINEILINAHNEIEKQDIKFDSPQAITEEETAQHNPSIESVYAYLQGMKNYLEGNFSIAQANFNLMIQSPSDFHSFAYFTRGLVNMLQQNFKEAIADFEAIPLENVDLKGYADGMTLRALMFSDQYQTAELKISPFKEEEPLAYWSWESTINMYQQDWQATRRSAELWLEYMQGRKTNSVEVYMLGLAYFQLAWASKQLSQADDFNEALQLLKSLLKQEANVPKHLHLKCLIQILENIDAPSFAELQNLIVNKAHLSRLDFNGLRPYLNLLMDLKFINQQKLVFQKFKEDIWNSLTKNKTLNFKTKNNDILNTFLGLETQEAVILLQGNSVLGEKIYCYAKYSLGNFRRLRDAMVRGDYFKASDYGEVIIAGQGTPSYENMHIAKLKFGMIDIKTYTPIWEKE